MLKFLESVLAVVVCMLLVLIARVSFFDGANAKTKETPTKAIDEPVSLSSASHRWLEYGYRPFDMQPSQFVSDTDYNVSRVL